VAQSAVSGAVVLGGADRLLDAVLGVRIGGLSPAGAAGSAAVGTVDGAGLNRTLFD
jgi:hypothetical protein